jgi:CoA:oxalate CoA-transferase
MYDATVSLLEGAALAYLATGEDPPRMGNAHFAITPFDTFACADREITICAANDLLFGALCTALELPALLTDPRFATNALRFESRVALKEAFEQVLVTASAAHWLARLEAAGVPCGPIHEVSEAVSSEQSVARRMVVDAGGVPVPGNPVKLSAWPEGAGRRRAPLLDEHGPVIRGELRGELGAG